MTNILHKTYKELAIPYFKEVFMIVDEVLTHLKIPYYLIGVNAVALELLKQGVKPARGTKDIDFAIMISSIAEFEKAVEYLVSRGFNKVKSPWTLYHEKYNTVVDLLPFGQIQENDTEDFNRRYSDLHVLGFNEVLQDSVPVYIEEKVARIPPLHGMIILKLIAWSDRPEERDSDLGDILLVIRKYFELEWEEIVTHHFDAFPKNEIDRLLISARVLGRKASGIINKSHALQSRIQLVLQDNIYSSKSSRIGSKWAKENDWTLEYAVNILRELKTGIEEGS